MVIGLFKLIELLANQLKAAKGRHSRASLLKMLRNLALREVKERKASFDCLAEAASTNEGSLRAKQGLRNEVGRPLSVVVMTAAASVHEPVLP